MGLQSGLVDAGTPSGHLLAKHDVDSRDGTVDIGRDRELVERCQAGDRAAFDALYLRYHRRLHRFCVQRLHEQHDAEDVVQEAFARAWRALPRLAGDRRFYPWLTVIAAHLCVDTVRQRSRQTPVEASTIEGADIGTYDTEDAVLHEVDSQLVATAFSHLSGRYQRVLQLREGSEWSYQRIADHEGVGVTAIETLLWRARQALKREFALLDQPQGRVGALAGMIVLLPARLIARLPKAARHAAGGVRRAVATIGHGGVLGGIGSPDGLGIFGPSVAAATGAVALSVGTILLLPLGITPGSAGPSPVAAISAPAPGPASGQGQAPGSAPVPVGVSGTGGVDAGAGGGQPGLPASPSTSSDSSQGAPGSPGVASAAEGLASGAGGTVGGIGGTTLPGGAGGDGVAGAVPGPVGSAVDGLASTAGSTANGALSTVGAAADGATSTLGSAADGLASTVGAAGGGLGATAGSLGSTAGSSVAGAGATAGTVPNGLGSTVTGTAGGLQSVVDGLLGGLGH